MLNSWRLLLLIIVLGMAGPAAFPAGTADSTIDLKDAQAIWREVMRG